MRTSEAGLALIRTHEGLRLKSYLCPAGKWTVGYGHTRGVTANSTCTKAEAEIMLVADCTDCEDAIHHLVKVPIRQTQFDALVSFVFNFGGRKFEKSTLLKLINDRSLISAAKEFPKWVNGLNPKTGKYEILNGLVLRRADERALFES